MPEAPMYSFDTPLGKIKIQCRKDDKHFYCHVNAPFYKNELKLDKAKLTEGALKFVEWLK